MQKVAYFNGSGNTIPPWGIVQLDGSAITTAAGQYVLNAVQPTSGAGPYLIDDGKGASSSGAGSYGTAFRAVDGCVWVAYTGSGAPTAWQEVGPVSGSFAVTTAGAGYYYAGQYDATNNRILVTAKSLSGLSTYMVTQLTSGANAVIVREPVLSFDANTSYPTFSAQPMPPSSFITLASIDHSKDVSVSSTCLTGPLFTGQIFTVLGGSTKIALGGDGTRYRAVMAAGGATGATIAVTLKYLSNITTPQTANIFAVNDTGVTLTTSQLVIVDLMNHLAGTVSRWRISEYLC